MFPQKEKPTARNLWRWVMSADDAMKPLSQQPPCARAHACTTTTCAHTDLAKIAETNHGLKDIRLARANGQVTGRLFGCIVSMRSITIFARRRKHNKLALSPPKFRRLYVAASRSAPRSREAVVREPWSLSWL